MKKTAYLALQIIMIAALAGCGSKNADTPVEDTSDAVEVSESVQEPASNDSANDNKASDDLKPTIEEQVIVDSDRLTVKAVSLDLTATDENVEMGELGTLNLEVTNKSDDSYSIDIYAKFHEMDNEMGGGRFTYDIKSKETVSAPISLMGLSVPEGGYSFGQIDVSIQELDMTDGRNFTTDLYSPVIKTSAYDENNYTDPFDNVIVDEQTAFEDDNLTVTVKNGVYNKATGGFIADLEVANKTETDFAIRTSSVDGCGINRSAIQGVTQSEISYLGFDLNDFFDAVVPAGQTIKMKYILSGLYIDKYNDEVKDVLKNNAIESFFHQTVYYPNDSQDQLNDKSDFDLEFKTNQYSNDDTFELSDPQVLIDDGTLYWAVQFNEEGDMVYKASYSGDGRASLEVAGFDMVNAYEGEGENGGYHIYINDDVDASIGSVTSESVNFSTAETTVTAYLRIFNGGSEEDKTYEGIVIKK